MEISTRGKAPHDITEAVRTQLRAWDVREGMSFLFLPHTSAEAPVVQALRTWPSRLTRRLEYAVWDKGASGYVSRVSCA